MIDMMDVIYLTLFIVFVTFLIGFVVAWFISLIVPITDVAAFFDEHQDSLKRLKRIEKARKKGKKVKAKRGNELEDYYYESHPDALADDLREEESRMQDGSRNPVALFGGSDGKKRSSGKKKVDAVKE